MALVLTSEVFYYIWLDLGIPFNLRASELLMISRSSDLTSFGSTHPPHYEIA
jgi:hypothetical protein